MASFFEYLFYFLFFYFAITVFYLFSLSLSGRVFSRKLAKAVPDPLVCGDCSAVLCRVCGTPLESADELAFG